jgi:HipA-like protein
MKKKLNIFAGDLLVGYLSESTAKGMSFVYAPAWLASADAMSLSSDLPLSDQTYHGEPVVAFFENLLPEGDVLEFISKAVQISSGNTFGLLERFGGDTIGSEEAEASVCPQNRAYGSVHGSSRKIDPLIHVKPVCELLVGPNGLSFNLDKPLIRISSGHRHGLAKRPALPIGKGHGCRFR